MAIKLKPDGWKWEAVGPRQELLRKLIQDKMITFVSGPAGTGKTLVATYCGMDLLDKKLSANGVDGMVISRPLISAGEGIGYLPGDVDDKINPYMRAVQDIILDSNHGMTQTWLFSNEPLIECIPVELMRGLTYTNKYCLIDEAQNLSIKQMEMVMTRLGQNSKMVICGDINQIDLKGPSGFAHALELFKDDEDFGKVEFTLEDIQRAGIVRKVIIAYHEQRKKNTPRESIKKTN